MPMASFRILRQRNAAQRAVLPPPCHRDPQVLRSTRIGGGCSSSSQRRRDNRSGMVAAISRTFGPLRKKLQRACRMRHAKPVTELEGIAAAFLIK